MIGTGIFYSENSCIVYQQYKFCYENNYNIISSKSIEKREKKDLYYHFVVHLKLTQNGSIYRPFKLSYKDSEKPKVGY